MSIKVTDNAVKEIRRVMEEQQYSITEYALEVGVVGGGCSGFQYKLGFKKKEEIDQLNSTYATFGEIDTVVANNSIPYLEGTTIDFMNEIDKRGFVFENPNAKRGCGCGNSFST